MLLNLKFKFFFFKKKTKKKKLLPFMRIKIFFLKKTF